MMADLAVSNEHLYTNIYDYGYSERSRKVIKTVSYAELRSGEVEIEGRKIKTAPLSSLFKARKIADELKAKLLNGEFVMTRPASMLPHRKSLNVLKRGNK